MADFDIWDKGEEASSSDLEEAMFGRRETCSAAARAPIESNVPFRKGRTLSGSGTHGEGGTLLSGPNAVSAVPGNTRKPRNPRVEAVSNLLAVGVASQVKHAGWGAPHLLCQFLMFWEIHGRKSKEWGAPKYAALP
eukprot:5367464-Amphidinium_carterae.1